MKRLFLLILMFFTVLSCENDNFGTVENALSVNSLMNKVSASSHSVTSAGELHNMHLDEIFDYLTAQHDLNSSNIDQYSHNYFNSIEYGNLATNSYNNVRANGEYDFEFSEDFINEMENLNLILETSDFANMEDFKNYILTYNPTFLEDENDLIAWEYYVDVFSHSFEYWAGNSHEWMGLVSGKFNLLSSEGGKCKDGGWWKRTWCNVRSFVVSDAAAAASNVIVTLIAGTNPVTFSAVAGAALGASAAAIIKDIF